MDYRIPFGNLKVGDAARRRIAEALDSNWISEGRFVQEFEQKFAAKLGWKHALATSSGTTAGEVVWSAVRELLGHTPHSCQGNMSRNRGFVATPACAFVATANCILAAGMEPLFVDIALDSLNMDGDKLTQVLSRADSVRYRCDGINFVATMGKPSPIAEVAEIAGERDLYLIGDFCEGHGARYKAGVWQSHGLKGDFFADHFCDASIYSFYTAHLIVGGEGGIICTDDDEIANLCRSIKNHGRPAGSNYFDFKRIGFNAKWGECQAAIALESLEKFDEVSAKRREVRAKLIQALEPFEDRLILYRDSPEEIISPHAFPLVLRDEAADVRPLYDYLNKSDIQVKTLFGSLPTDHAAFKFLGYKEGDFPVAERIGRTGLHLPCNEFMTDEDVAYVADRIRDFCQREKS